jgi:hypothetical protein
MSFFMLLASRLPEERQHEAEFRSQDSEFRIPDFSETSEVRARCSADLYHPQPTQRVSGNHLESAIEQEPCLAESKKEHASEN